MFCSIDVADRLRISAIACEIVMVTKAKIVGKIKTIKSWVRFSVTGEVRKKFLTRDLLDLGIRLTDPLDESAHSIPMLFVLNEVKLPLIKITV